MQQQGLTKRLQIIRERCMAVSGGINAVAKEMGRAKGTLRNWFRGDTTPTVDDVELLVTTVTLMEAADAAEAQKAEERLNAALGGQPVTTQVAA